MRGTCFGMMLLFAAVSGCATPEGEASGFMGNYGGFPWPSLLRKNAAQNDSDTFLQPTYSGSGRFTRPPTAAVGSVTPNQALATPTLGDEPPVTRSASAQAPAEKSSSEE